MFQGTGNQDLANSDKKKGALIAATVVDRGRGDPSQTIKEIQRLLEEIGAKAEALRRVSTPAYQTMHIIENLEAHVYSLEDVEDSVGGPMRFYKESSSWG